MVKCNSSLPSGNSISRVKCLLLAELGPFGELIRVEDSNKITSIASHNAIDANRMCAPFLNDRDNVFGNPQMVARLKVQQIDEAEPLGTVCNSDVEALASSLCTADQSRNRNRPPFQSKTIIDLEGMRVANELVPNRLGAESLPFLRDLTK
jgi:hypothetical protein